MGYGDIFSNLFINNFNQTGNVSSPTSNNSGNNNTTQGYEDDSFTSGNVSTNVTRERIVEFLKSYGIENVSFTDDSIDKLSYAISNLTESDLATLSTGSLPERIINCLEQTKSVIFAQMDALASTPETFGTETTSSANITGAESAISDANGIYKPGAITDLSPDSVIESIQEATANAILNPDAGEFIEILNKIDETTLKINEAQGYIRTAALEKSAKLDEIAGVNNNIEVATANINETVVALNGTIEEIEVATDEISITAEQIDETVNQLDETSAAHTQTLSDISSTESNISSLESALSKADDNQKSSIESQLRTARQKLSELKQTEASQSEALANLEEQKMIYQQNLMMHAIAKEEALEATLNEQIATIEGLEEEINGYEAQITELESELSSIQEDIRNYRSDITKLKEQNNALRAEFEKLLEAAGLIEVEEGEEEGEDPLAEAFERTKKDLDDTDREIAVTEQVITELETKYTETETKIKETKATVTATKTEVSDLKEEANTVKETLDSLKTKLSTLKDKVENLVA